MSLTTALRSITLVLALAAPVALGVGFVAGSASPAVAQAPAAATKYTLDLVHSTVLFKVKHANASWAYGRFNDFSGTLMFDAAKPEASSFEVSIKADSIDTANAKRDQHLTSPDFFNAAEFPTIDFKSTSLKKTGEHTYELAGNVTLLGVTKPVTAKLEHTGNGKNNAGAEVIGAEATFTIKRSDFGMTYGLAGIGDEVHITVSIEGIKA